MTELQKDHTLEEYEKTFFRLMWKRKDFLAHYKHDLYNSSLQEVVEYWRDYVLPNYKRQFKEEIKEMLECGIFPEKFRNGKTFIVEGFKYIPHLDVIAWIKQQKRWPEAKQKEIELCYRFFIKWLEEISFGQLSERVLLYDHKSVANDVFTFSDWRVFFESLYKQNKRDALIAGVMMQGKKRVSEVIGLTIDQVNFERDSITFKSKKGDEEIMYEVSFMQDLKNYVDSTASIRNKTNYVFITRTGKRVTRRRLNYSFEHICNETEIKKITPDSIRNLWDEFTKQKYLAKHIMQSKKNRIEEIKKSNWSNNEVPR